MGVSWSSRDSGNQPTGETKFDSPCKGVSPKNDNREFEKMQFAVHDQLNSQA